MLINQEMHNKILGIILTLLEQKERVDRKKIKILYDSVIEQVSEKLFNIKYQNYLTTLAGLNQINENLLDLGDQESSLKIHILKKLRNMLEGNCPLDDSSYTDKSQDIIEFIKNRFLPFIIAVSDYDILQEPNSVLLSLNQYLKSLQR
jgi:hypothetical protein